VVAVNDIYLLRNIWYHAMPSRELKAGKMVAKTLLNEPILFGRTRQGKAFALRDICPHRAVPLSCGRFDGTEVECCYHGWRFDENGKCTEIPSLMPDQQMDLSRFDVNSYEVKEVQGNLWVYIRDRAIAPSLPASTCPGCLALVTR
jgi:phenylpropionate dioxygenase-like ring-hydroxylating dioxygenase large terminal subunit